MNVCKRFYKRSF